MYSIYQYFLHQVSCASFSLLLLVIRCGSQDSIVCSMHVCWERRHLAICVEHYWSATTGASSFLWNLFLILLSFAQRVWRSFSQAHVFCFRFLQGNDAEPTATANVGHPTTIMSKLEPYLIEARLGQTFAQNHSPSPVRCWMWDIFVYGSAASEISSVSSLRAADKLDKLCLNCG